MKQEHPAVFISAGIGAWYNTGIDRFKGSLIDKGVAADFQFWKDEWPPGKFPRECIYTIKAAAFEFAIKSGYKTIIWGDASVWAVNPVNGFINEVNAKGYWLGHSGHNAAQTCSDACLKYFGITRDEAEKIHDCATGLFGVNLDFDGPRRFIERFIQAGRDQAFHGARNHAGQSGDRRFLYHRQDQSCATIIAHQEGMKLDAWQSRVAFRWDKTKPEHVFRCEGM